MLKQSVVIVLMTCSIIMPQSFETELDKLLSLPFFQSSQISISVYDLGKGKSVYSRNSSLLMTPASNMKILTSAAALLYLKPNYNFNTFIAFNGLIIDGTLNGDLWLSGGFDPILSSNHLEKLAGQVKAAGIKVIEGDIAADQFKKDSLFWGSGWMWDDDPSTDAPYLGSLNINRNTVTVKVSSGQEGKMPDVSLSPSSSYFNVINNALTVPGSAENIIIQRDWINRSNNIIVAGTIGSKSVSSVIKSFNVWQPEMYALTLFREALERQGIVIKGKTVLKKIENEVNIIASVDTPVDTILSRVNKYSDNLSAEMLLYALSSQYFKPPASSQKGLRFIDSLILRTGFDPASFSINDGSGVSRYNLVSTELIIEVLKMLYEKYPIHYSRLRTSLAVSGIDGTLESRLATPETYGKVFAKTGTLRGVSTLSGYITTAAGNLLAFSLFIQNYVGKTSYARELIDQICTLLIK